MNGWLYYGTKHLQVVPYMEGTPCYRDGMLPHLYTRTKEEGKIEATFCGDTLNLDQFVAFFEKRKTLQVLCEVEANKDIKPVGYSWVEWARGVDGARAAMCGFCFFNGASHRTAARDLGWLGLAYWFIDLRIDVLHGVALASNVPAKNYARHLGFREVGVVPDYFYHDGKLVDGRVSVLRAVNFLPGFETWFSQQEPAAT